MPKQSVDVLVEGGKATAAPPLGPALGPLGVNIGQVVAEINSKTSGFKGMQVPVKVIVDVETRTFTITIGTPPTAALILKEAGVQKGAHNAKLEKIADIRIEQIIRIAKMKEGNLMGKDMKSKVKEVIGTCTSVGVLVHGMTSIEAIQAVNAGKFDQEIKEQKTELTAEELKTLEVEKKRLQEQIEKRRKDILDKANDIIKKFEGKERAFIKAKLIEAEIPKEIIEELLPAAGGAAAEGGAAPAAGAAAAPAAAEKKA